MVTVFTGSAQGLEFQKHRIKAARPVQHPALRGSRKKIRGATCDDNDDLRSLSSFTCICRYSFTKSWLMPKS